MATVTEEYIDLTGIATAAGVTIATASDWLRRGLLPQPLPTVHRSRRYRFPRTEALAAVKRVMEAKAVLAGRQFDAAGGEGPDQPAA
jgi:predicted site-specific integrase-resolvase